MTQPQAQIAEMVTFPGGLAHQRPGAAASLHEGLADTFTINRLGVTGKLRRTLRSTNTRWSR